MAATRLSILAINAGSSSIKFAVYQAKEFTPVLRGQLDRIGLEGTMLSWTTSRGSGERRLEGRNHEAATSQLIEWLQTQDVFESIRADRRSGSRRDVLSGTHRADDRD
jgi:acetate kinase